MAVVVSLPSVQIILVALGVGGVFFFQAEDGIRDDLATGVQTCALPICTEPGEPAGARRNGFGRWMPNRLSDSWDTWPSTRSPVACPSRAERRLWNWRRRRSSWRLARDRKSVVSGKGVDLGGRRIIKKKK